VPEVRRAPGVIEADSFDQALFVRGDHPTPLPRGLRHQGLRDPAKRPTGTR
jgi:hypothetical protein